MLVQIFATAVALHLSAAQAPIDVKSRLDAYEKRLTRTGKADPAELELIARAVFERTRRSATFRVWSEACATKVVSDGDNCGQRLWTVLRTPAESIRRRAEAASALIMRSDTAAGETLYEAIKAFDAAALAPLAPIIQLLPPRRALPLLIRLTESPAHEAAGCRALGSIDEPESRTALANAVASNPPGTDTWKICMIARGRLKERDAVVALYGYSLGMENENLLDAADAMLHVGDERGVEALRELTRRGRSPMQLAAADLLISRDPETATRVARTRRRDQDPEIRSSALEIERHLKLEADETDRRLLLDPSPIVQLRAAELVIDWARRQQSR